MTSTVKIVLLVVGLAAALVLALRLKRGLEILASEPPRPAAESPTGVGAVRVDVAPGPDSPAGPGSESSD